MCYSISAFGILEKSHISAKLSVGDVSDDEMDCDVVDSDDDAIGGILSKCMSLLYMYNKYTVI